MKQLRRLTRFLPLFPMVLRLLADAVEAYEDGKLDRKERTKLTIRFYAIVKRASKIAGGSR